MQTKHVIQSILISLALSAALTYAVNARPEPTVLDKHGTVTAIRKGYNNPKVFITVTGKDGWMINTEYNAKITIGDTELRKADGLYKDINKKGDKAAAATWITESMAKSGKVRLVFCNSTSCTAPINGTFEVKTK